MHVNVTTVLTIFCTKIIWNSFNFLQTSKSLKWFLNGVPVESMNKKMYFIFLIKYLKLWFKKIWNIRNKIIIFHYYILRVLLKCKACSLVYSFIIYKWITLWFPYAILNGNLGIIYSLCHISNYYTFFTLQMFSSFTHLYVYVAVHKQHIQFT